MVASPGSFLFAGPLASANGESRLAGQAGPARPPPRRRAPCPPIPLPLRYPEPARPAGAGAGETEPRAKRRSRRPPPPPLPRQRSGAATTSSRRASPLPSARSPPARPPGRAPFPPARRPRAERRRRAEPDPTRPPRGGRPRIPPDGSAPRTAPRNGGPRRDRPRSAPERPGTRRSWLHLPGGGGAPQQPRADLLDLPSEDPARVEEMVAHRRLAAPEDLGDLVRVLVLHLAQDERGLLLAAQPLARLTEDPRHIGVLGGAGRFASRRFLAPPDHVQDRAVRPLPAPGAPQEVDGEVGSDPVDPGVERVLLVVAVELLPDAQKDQLRHVAGVFGVGHDAPGDGDDRGGLSGDQGLERDHVSGPRGERELPVGKLLRLLPAAGFAVDKLHRRFIRIGTAGR